MGFLNRRVFLVGAAGSVLGACGTEMPGGSVSYAPGAKVLLVGSADEAFPIAPVALSTIPSQFHRQAVQDPTGEPTGTIVVDPGQRYLYLVLADGRAMRYGIGVGREGFGWSGVASIQRKQEWPDWHPPVEMQARDEKARLWAQGMPGGPENPLGARALYLYQNSKDTLYRIHGTNEPHSIGRAVSSGCIRMLNADIIDLYERVPVGTRVVVLPPLNPFAQIEAVLPDTGAS